LYSNTITAIMAGAGLDDNDYSGVGAAGWLHSWMASLQFLAMSVVGAPGLLRDNVAHLCDIVGTK
jgi:hypothetical protein